MLYHRKHLNKIFFNQRTLVSEALDLHQREAARDKTQDKKTETMAEAA